jgi:tight adherence protein B
VIGAISDPFWLMLPSGALASLGAALLLRAALLAPGAHCGHQLWSETRVKVARELLFVRAGLSAEALMGAQLALLLLSLVAAFSSVSVTSAFLFGAVAPSFLLKRARALRVRAIEGQIEGWVGSLGRALEAAPSLGEALEVSITTCDSPLRDELKVVVNEIHLGRPLDQALNEWSHRVKSRTLTLALATLKVGRDTGGRLGDVLKSAAASLREMERLEGVLRTKTAEGRAQAWVISVIPIPLYFAVQASDPLYFRPLETSASGHIMMTIAVGLWIAAGFSARKILAVRI